jgi:hypothetical protein
VVRIFLTALLGRARLDPARLVKIEQIATRRPLSPSRAEALRIRAVVLGMDRKTKEGDCKKADETDQSDPPGGNVGSEQGDQTRKRNRLRKRHTGTPPDRVGSLRQSLCMSYGGFQAVEIKINPNALHQTVRLTFHVYIGLSPANFPWPVIFFFSGSERFVRAL